MKTQDAADNANIERFNTAIENLVDARWRSTHPDLEHHFNPKRAEQLEEEHDFAASMLGLNKDLLECMDSQPALFGAYYVSLRTAAPEITNDPIILGTHLRKMVVNQVTAGVVPLELQRAEHMHSLITREKRR
jgi:hypothetical protein